MLLIYSLFGYATVQIQISDYLLVLSALFSPVWERAPVHQHLLVLPHDRTKPLLCNHTSSGYLPVACIPLKTQLNQRDKVFWAAPWSATFVWLWQRGENVVGGLWLVIRDGALRRKGGGDNEPKVLVFTSLENHLKGWFWFTWCLLMMSLSLLACFCSISGDKKTVGLVKQLFWKRNQTIRNVL